MRYGNDHPLRIESVKNLQAGGKRLLEDILGQQLQENQKVFIMSSPRVKNPMTRPAGRLGPGWKPRSRRPQLLPRARNRRRGYRRCPRRGDGSPSSPEGLSVSSSTAMSSRGDARQNQCGPGSPAPSPEVTHGLISSAHFHRTGAASSNIHASVRFTVSMTLGFSITSSSCSWAPQFVTPLFRLRFRPRSRR